MRDGYVVPSERKKILLLSDDFRNCSGVATISREIILSTVHRYNWVQIGAAIRSDFDSQELDMSEKINEETGLTDASVKIITRNGYGDQAFLLQVLSREKPDAVFLFTDPRYWIWLFEMEQEIRAKVPIIYLNIWDNLPYPFYNEPYYRSCDGLLAISKQTKNINEQVLGQEAAKHVIRYIPHGVSSKYFPIENPSENVEYMRFRRKLRGKSKFVLLYNARNLSRKQTGNLILAWQQFCNTVGKDKAIECKLVCHTDMVDRAGTDLGAIYRDLCDNSYVKIDFIQQKFTTECMNYLYNASDGVILVSSNEGWGLSLTEALMTGKMFIATVTGGMQDQMRFEDRQGNWIDFSEKFPSNHTGLFKDCGDWAIPVFPSNISLQGSPITPYIFDDRVDIQQISDAILKLYNYSNEERQLRGMKGHKWAISEEAGFTSEQMGKRLIEGIDATLEHFKLYSRQQYTFERIEKTTPRLKDYNPVKI